MHVRPDKWWKDAKLFAVQQEDQLKNVTSSRNEVSDITVTNLTRATTASSSLQQQQQGEEEQVANLGILADFVVQ